jgi:hypothetical protein
VSLTMVVAVLLQVVDAAGAIAFVFFIALVVVQ